MRFYKEKRGGRIFSDTELAHWEAIFEFKIPTDIEFYLYIIANF